MKKYGFGVDIGGTTIKMSLFEMTGHMLDKWEIPTNTQNNGASILDDVAAVIEGRLVQEGIAKEDVEGIGIGPGRGCIRGNGMCQPGVEPRGSGEGAE